MIYCENIVNVTLFFFYSPQISEPLFFSPIFGNVIATIVTIFFSPYFGNGIATISLSIFFFLFTLGTPRTLLILGQQNWAEEFRNPRCRNSTFSLSTFFFFSLVLLVEFQQWQYRNSVSLFRIPNKFQQFL